MTYYNLFRQPYLNAEDDFSGGSDDGFEVDTIEAEEVETTTETVETVEDTKPTETVTEYPKYKLKYNHEEKEVTLDELTILGQKGMNYDKLQEKFNEIQNNPALSKYSKVQEVSELLGYQSDDELLDALYDTYYQRTAETKGYTPEQVKKDHELTAKEKAVAEKEAKLTDKEKNDKMYLDFATNFPEVKAEMIKPETWDKVKAGTDLSTAYTQQVNMELLNEIKILKQNAENIKKAPIGGVSTHGSDTTQKDDFLEGFDED